MWNQKRGKGWAYIWHFPLTHPTLCTRGNGRLSAGSLEMSLGVRLGSRICLEGEAELLCITSRGVRWAPQWLPLISCSIQLSIELFSRSNDLWVFVSFWLPLLGLFRSRIPNGNGSMREIDCGEREREGGRYFQVGLVMGPRWSWACFVFFFMFFSKCLLMVGTVIRLVMNKFRDFIYIILI